MPKLHLGVINQPYPNLSRGRKTRRRSGGHRQTTEQVSEALEARYGIMGHFWEKYHQEIASILEADSHEQIRASVGGIPPTGRQYKSAERRIADLFRKFILNREMDGLVPGVPTKASWKGVNRTLSHPYSRYNPVRPSFVDTGLYLRSFRAWFE